MPNDTPPKDNPSETSTGMPLVELLFEWGIPFVGALATGLILKVWTPLPNWAICCLALPVAIAFQWLMALILIFLAKGK